MNKIFSILLIATFFISCSERKEPLIQSDLELKMNSIAEDYVKLVLNIGQYDANFVDAYYGPEEWRSGLKTDLQFDSTAYNKLSSETDELLNQLESLSDYKATELETLRFRYLYKQLLACKTYINMLNGIVLPFDMETKALYDAEAPVHNDEYFQDAITELDKILPGKGDVAKRLNDFKMKFVIPADKLKEVFDAAIKECRMRTLNFIKLPEKESFKVEYVKDKPWGAYNWYKGNYFSLIEVNTDLPVFIDRAVDLAAHEGYPGHHVYNTLLEQNLSNGRNWTEFKVYALFSPQSLIAEGTANYGIAMAFPGNERIKFEKEILFPIAGINPDDADLYYKVIDLQKSFSYAGNEAARNYLDEKWNREQTVEWLQKNSLRTKESADKYVSFIETYRSYVINYNLGYDIVKNYIESNGGTIDNLKKRWELFEYLLSTPQTPGALIK
ncbi:MAG TPA: hypothetical protein PK195_05235 [Ignavibacteriaceae bacterium]|jgi:hypothetical protein|nr:MAG: hypothetical protein BWY38_00696 [Ignavibacteria bacterium ADurb.Bin266]HQI42346.1 hypothetical protein [Ignavibacteriaceae bacterium]HQJ46021.1 hypothetical protein [Ignavibacteriaceae bacterium]